MPGLSAMRSCMAAFDRWPVAGSMISRWPLAAGVAIVLASGAGLGRGRAVASEQFRNSNAYAAPGDIAEQSYLQNEDEGAMTSGLAGH